MFMIGERNEACVNLLADDANEGKNVVCENSETLIMRLNTEQ